MHVKGAGDGWFDAYLSGSGRLDGCGGAFNGGLVAALAAGLELPDAIDLGMRAGAFCVTKAGVAAGLPTLGQLDAAIPARNSGVRH